jgi:phosphohistidine phosphatase SixA
MMRAKRWATYFEPIKIDAIYITQYIRTKQTISLIAQQKQISPKRYDPNTVYSKAFLKETNGKTVLIAGHSNTTPQLVNKLIGEEKFKEMDDSDNSTLFKVTINGNDKKVETITVE